MTRRTPLAIALTLAAALTACEGGKDETHYTRVEKESLSAYADQKEDSLKVLSYDSWTLRNSTDWVSVKCDNQTDELSVTVPAGYARTSRIDLVFQPNTTGKTRGTLLQISTSYGSNLAARIAQRAHLNVRRPEAREAPDGTATFSANIAAKPAGKPSVSFVVYTDNATLASSDESWLKPEKTSGFKAGQEESVQLTVTENTAAAPRTATLTLTSAGVSTPITVTQSGTGQTTARTEGE